MSSTEYSDGDVNTIRKCGFYGLSSATNALWATSILLHIQRPWTAGPGAFQFNFAADGEFAVRTFNNSETWSDWRKVAHQDWVLSQLSTSIGCCRSSQLRSPQARSCTSRRATSPTAGSSVTGRTSAERPTRTSSPRSERSTGRGTGRAPSRSRTSGTSSSRARRRRRMWASRSRLGYRTSRVSTQPRVKSGPNITGSGPLAANGAGDGDFSGAFYRDESMTGAIAEGGSTDSKVSFSASRSSGLYGASTTVQPPAIRLLPSIKS